MPTRAVQSAGDPAQLQPLRKRLLQRHQDLKSKRSSWDAHWRDLADHILPRAERFYIRDRSRQGTKRNTKIINSTGTFALRVLASGMHAGITSPARPWFRLVTPEPEMMKVSDIKRWLGVVEERMRTIFSRSNLYTSLPKVYRDLGCFSCTAMQVEEDEDDVIRTYVRPVGSYCLQNGAREIVDTIYYELSMTVGQLVERWGTENLTPPTKNLFDQAKYDADVDVLHVVEPNRHANSANNQWPLRSIWLEINSDDSEAILHEGGFEEFPVMAPRWDRTGNDSYGNSPCMDALGDIRQLQTLEKDRGQITAKLARPPMVGPSSLKNTRDFSALPGSVTFTDVLNQGQGWQAAYVPPPQSMMIKDEVAMLENRINRALFLDLFLMLANSPSPQKTAREIEERHEEKMLQLGPVLESLQDELLDPLIDRTFAIGFRRGQFPQPPPELEGMPLRVEYISILAQAQKMVGTVAVERLGGFIAGLSEMDPDAPDKLNTDRAIDRYAEMLGTPPDVVRDDKEVAARREERRKQQEAAQAAEMAKTMGQAAGAASGAIENNSALGHLLSTMPGAGGPPAAGGP